MKLSVDNISRLLLASLGACVFWTAVATNFDADIMRPGEPHPGLKDGKLKDALRKDRRHQTLSYYEARKHLWGSIDGDGRDATCAYTGEKIEYFKQPIPSDGATEHAWPLTRLPAEARTDLHHLFAVAPDARVARLNLHYGKVLVPVWSRGGSRSGPSTKVKPVFEVRPEMRGDIARSMFYVSTMYGLEIPADEESELRKWHVQDPVSKAERGRNARVAEKQKSRNPFVDHPDLTKRISNF